MGFAQQALAGKLLSWLGPEVRLAQYPSDRDRLHEGRPEQQPKANAKGEKKKRNMVLNRCHGKEYEKQGVHREYPGR